MKKRNESSIVTAILGYLQVQENSKKIAWVDRIQTGRVISTWNYRSRKTGDVKKHFSCVKMCRPGTPDIYVLLNTGGVLWLECKNTGKQEIEQYQFEKMVSKLPMHHYFIVRCVDDVMKISKKLSLCFFAN